MSVGEGVEENWGELGSWNSVGNLLTHFGMVSVG